jgi:hypothetical protein
LRVKIRCSSGEEGEGRNAVCIGSSYHGRMSLVGEEGGKSEKDGKRKEKTAFFSCILQEVLARHRSVMIRCTVTVVGYLVSSRAVLTEPALFPLLLLLLLPILPLSTIIQVPSDDLSSLSKHSSEAVYPTPPSPTLSPSLFSFISPLPQYGLSRSRQLPSQIYHQPNHQSLILAYRRAKRPPRSGQRP